MRRRDFIKAIAGSATGVSLYWPLAARAQQRGEVRRIGVFMPGAPDNAEFEARNGAFLQALGELGWSVGRNIRVEYRWGAGSVSRYRVLAQQLVALGPDVIFANGTSTVTALQSTTSTVPIVFANVVDPVGSGLVANLAKPGGNITGFTSGELGFSAKWLELLKQVAPRVTRVALLRDSAIASQVGLLGGAQSVAPAMGIELLPIDLHDTEQIERAVTTFAHDPNGGLVVVPAAAAFLHRELIVTLAARYGLPAIYPSRSHVIDGGLMSYGANSIDVNRQAAGYVDRILKGEKPADLPVQAPTKFELVINLKTANTLGLTVPQSLLASADEVIE
jgi:ABC-type uncharacterized transport system substrate-binding protein